MSFVILLVICLLTFFFSYSLTSSAFDIETNFKIIFEKKRTRVKTLKKPEKVIWKEELQIVLKNEKPKQKNSL